ncbi:hypothetical protein FRC04_009792 [Tulasnella sp. 424]|nr:hypothetical protein FRC04_009792 [Tulasnella sp. 424]KAG8971159.1 hypothetical protein FRC05_011443 [Tulasnella sp. 425]
MAGQHSPFFQAQIASRFHQRSDSVTLSFLSYYDSTPATDAEAGPGPSSSAPTAPAAGPSTVQPSTHRRTSSATLEKGSPSMHKAKQHRRNSAISKRSTERTVPQPLASSSFMETQVDVGPAPRTAPLPESPRPSPSPEGAKKRRRAATRLRVANPSSAASSIRRPTPAPSIIEPSSPPPPYSLYPSQSIRRISVPTAGQVPTLPSSPYPRDVYRASRVPEASTSTCNRTGNSSPPVMIRQVRPLPPPPSVPKSPEPWELELELDLDLDLDLELEDPGRRPSLPTSESGASASTTTPATPTETESIHPFDLSDEEEADIRIETPEEDDDLHSFLDFSSSPSTCSDTTTGPARLPRKYRPTSIPVVGTFDPTSPEYSRATFGAGFKKQCKRMVATGKTKLVSVGRKRSGSTDSVESSGSQDIDWGDALEDTLFG